MIVTPHDGSVLVQCPAKVNLFFETRGRRPDGYHEIETVMQAVTVYDDIVLGPGHTGAIEFQCSDPALPTDERNLAVKAAEALRRATGFTQCVSIRLEKRIPHQAGLGGGSSDAAGVLVGLNQLLHLKLSDQKLSKIAAWIGADVPFFITGGTALCTGRGEVVRPIDVNLTCHYVIWKPDCGLSTALVYGNLSARGLTSGNASGSLLLKSLVAGDFGSLSDSLFNRLDEVATALSAEVAEIKSQLTGISGRRALVSGSGSAVFVLLDSATRASDVAAEVQARGRGRVLIAQSEHSARDPRG